MNYYFMTAIVSPVINSRENSFTGQVLPAVTNDFLFHVLSARHTLHLDIRTQRCNSVTTWRVKRKEIQECRPLGTRHLLFPSSFSPCGAGVNKVPHGKVMTTTIGEVSSVITVNLAP